MQSTKNPWSNLSWQALCPKKMCFHKLWMVGIGPWRMEPAACTWTRYLLYWVHCGCVSLALSSDCPKLQLLHLSSAEVKSNVLSCSLMSLLAFLQVSLCGHLRNSSRLTHLQHHTESKILEQIQVQTIISSINRSNNKLTKISLTYFIEEIGFAGIFAFYE